MKSWLFNIWKDISHKYGFEEYDAPVVEHLELYTRKAGEEVSQQLYEFKDKMGRRLSLRPEMTPSLARMIAAKKGSLRFPLKWFSVPQCWRYEKTTRGRRREHYQWNMDIIGIDNIEVEAELLSAIVSSFQKMGLQSKDVGIKINSRKLLNDLMKKVGIPSEQWIPAAVLIDKLDKINDISDLKESIEQNNLNFTHFQEITTYLRSNSTLEDYQRLLGEDSEGIQEIKSLVNSLAAYQIADWFVFDPTVVRGLAYYTGIVFEAFDRERKLRAICGGGRYNKILSTLGYTHSENNNNNNNNTKDNNKDDPTCPAIDTNEAISTQRQSKNKMEDIPAVGFGYGDAVIMELLTMKKLISTKQFENPTVDIIAYGMTPVYHQKLLPLIQDLRMKGSFAVDAILDERKMKWIFSKGDRIGCSYIIVLGEDEDAMNMVTLKDLKTGVQLRIEKDQLLPFLLDKKKTQPE
jgi:histidyl-tRNA synthetase